MTAQDGARARDALQSLPPDLARDAWVKVGMAFHAAGGDFDSFDQWSAAADSYRAADCRSTWKSFKSTPGGVTAGALFGMARDAGWQEGNASPRPARQRTTKPAEPPRKPAKGNTAIEVWSRCTPATDRHAYAIKKQASAGAMAGLRELPAGDPLRIMGEPMAGALVVPCWAADGTLATLQLIPTPDVAARLKANGKPGKLNLPGHSVQGWFTVGRIEPDKPIYIVEGVATGWACWQSTGAAAVVTFGCGNTRRIVESLRQRERETRIVIAPDRGKEPDAKTIASEFSCAVALMPEGWPNNSDLNDVFCSPDGGFDVVQGILEAATEPPKPEPRYKLLTRDDLAALPALTWRVRGVLPAVGVAAWFGPSASGKSFLAFDAGAAIADGQRWFDCRIEPAPVVYAALEGEAGFKQRAQAWEAHKGRALPDGLHMVLQPFKITDPRDVTDLAAVVPAGAVVFIDTLNRAAPTANENDSADMGEILEGAKRLQSLTGGLLVLIHHSGKDASKGLRGHSSLFAAMDACIEVTRDGDRREWKVSKAKDGEDGEARPFRLQVETLGLDAFGDPVTSCTVQPDTNNADIRRVKLPQGGNQRLVYEGIRGLFKTGLTGKPGAPPLRPCIGLEAAVAAGAARLTCASERKTQRTREAITGLVSRGVLGLNEGWLWTV